MESSNTLSDRAKTPNSSSARKATAMQSESSPEKSNNMRLLWLAILKSQGQLQSVTKSGSNPHFRSKYITLDSILAGPCKVFQANGIVILQTPTVGDSTVQVTTVLAHAETGTSLQFETAVPCDTSNSQKAGSGITYARRYALTSILGIASDEDDDGNAASNMTKASTSYRQQPQNQFTQQQAQAPAIDLGI